MLASYVGREQAVRGQYLAGQLEVEFVPQGTLAERLRAGGAGIPAFYTPTGVGTVIAEGKPHADFDGRTYCWSAASWPTSLWCTRTGRPGRQLRYRLTARNFNPLVATAGRVTVVEAEEIVGGEIDPDQVHTPGIYVHTVVACRPQDQGHRAAGTGPGLIRDGGDA